MNTEERVLQDIISRITHIRKEYECEYKYDDSHDNLMKLQAIYWIEDMFPIIYHDKELSIISFEGTPIYDAALTLKVYKAMQRVRIRVDGWNFEQINTNIDSIFESIFVSSLA